MFKIIKKLTLIIITVLAGLLAYRLATSPTLLRPFPYKFRAQDNKSLLNASEIKKIEESPILIVGDRMAVALDQYLPAKEMKIFNWGSNGEGLHRTIFKLDYLNSLKKLPPIIIYHGASQEYNEKKFLIKDREAILLNLKNYDNDFYNTVITLFPVLSRLIYTPLPLVTMEEQITLNDHLYKAESKLKQMEIGIRLFELEFEQLLDMIKRSKSRLIVLTTPINLDVPPKRTCENASTPSVVRKQNQLDQLLGQLPDRGAFEAAHRNLKKLAKITALNARSYFLLGKAAKKRGRFQEARDAMEFASALDCATWRTSMIHNIVIKHQTRIKHPKVEVIDFNQLVNGNYGRQPNLFKDQIYPRDVFYQKLLYKLSRISINEK